MNKIASQIILFFFPIFSVKNPYISNHKIMISFQLFFQIVSWCLSENIKFWKYSFYWQIFKVQLNVLKSLFYTSKSLKSKYGHFLLCNTNRCMYLPVDHLWLNCDINKTLLTLSFARLKCPTFAPIFYLRFTCCNPSIARIFFNYI